jgi:hypothetical protein
MISFLILVPLANAHIGAWAPGMFCRNGPQNSPIDWNSNTVVSPLYQLDPGDYWFGNGQTNGVSNHCYNFPPPDGEFLELPAGGSFDVQFANNRAFTTFGNQGGSPGVFPDGQTHSEYDQPGFFTEQCITQPILHTKSHADVAGSAFGIAYVSQYSELTPESMAVFTINSGTPWHTKASFQVPADLPACPKDGCLCGWGWVPNNCGQPNIYLQLFRCKVTGAKPNAPAVMPAQPAVWCENDRSSCVKGAKQMVVWNQNSGNTISFTGVGRAGEEDDLQQFSPGYGTKLGWSDGPQNDIFGSSPEPAGSSNTPTPGSHGAAAPVANGALAATTTSSGMTPPALETGLFAEPGTNTTDGGTSNRASCLHRRHPPKSVTSSKNARHNAAKRTNRL